MVTLLIIKMKWIWLAIIIITVIVIDPIVREEGLAPWEIVKAEVKC